MPTYTLHAINLGGFNLGEADKVITLFSAERGLVRAVAKGVRKPGAKIAGRAEPLNVNKLLLAKGRNLDIITQAESIASFSHLRHDLEKLAYGLYYAELTNHFGEGLADESAAYFDFLIQSLQILSNAGGDAVLLCLRFAMALLATLGYKPELDVCLNCRQPLTEYNLAVFHHDFGGIICDRCQSAKNISKVGEQAAASDTDAYITDHHQFHGDARSSTHAKAAYAHITPLVWKRLILALSEGGIPLNAEALQAHIRHANTRACRLVQDYLEYRAGKHMKSLDLLEHISL